MPKYNALLYHKMALLLIEYKVGLLASDQHRPQFLQTIIKGATQDRKIIHEDLDCFFNHIGEYGHHTTLECARRIAQPEGHPPECECTVGTCECTVGTCECTVRTCEYCLLLIFRSYKNLIVAGISIQQAIVFVSG